MATRIPGPVTGTAAHKDTAAHKGAAAPSGTTARSGTTASGPPYDPVARTAGLTKTFGPRTVLDGVDLEIGRGEFVALLGRSGSGKSTLLRALAGLDRDTGGELAVHGTVAFQEPWLVPWKKVWANVALGLRVPEPRRAAESALAEVELAERSKAWPLTLSGGEAQRASLARALVREPGLLLLDEPFSALHRRSSPRRRTRAS